MRRPRARRDSACGATPWRRPRSHLSVAADELAAAIERLQGDAKAQQRTLRGFQEKLAGHEAQALLAKATRSDGRLVIVEALEGWDAQGLKAIAVAAAAEKPNAVVALFTTATPALVVIARGSAATADASAVLKGWSRSLAARVAASPTSRKAAGFPVRRPISVAEAKNLIVG